MRSKGGYDIRLAGRPSTEIEVLPEPEELHIPLWSDRFTFPRVQVKDRESVDQGQVIARDPHNHNIPLLAPRAGSIRIGAYDKHITLRDIEPGKEEPFNAGEEEVQTDERTSSADKERQTLVELGAWQYLKNVRSDHLPDPLDNPSAVIVNTLQYEPYMAQIDAQIDPWDEAFLYGVQRLQSMFSGVPVYVTLAEDGGELNERIRREAGKLDGVKLIEVPVKYPHDNPALLARRAGFDTRQEKVWELDGAGVKAVDRALRLSLPCTEKVISFSGPTVKNPCHLKAMVGYPLTKLFHGRLLTMKEDCRFINGGVLTGKEVPTDMIGLPAECSGLTVLEEHTEREFLGFLRPGLNKTSYTNTFFGSLCRGLQERLNTGLNGEPRACICCGYCQSVCPASIKPHLIHRHLYGDDIEEAERLRLDLCVGCGLCSYVCPSKIDLSEEIVTTREHLIHEHEMA